MSGSAGKPALLVMALLVALVGISPVLAQRPYRRSGAAESRRGLRGASRSALRPVIAQAAAGGAVGQTIAWGGGGVGEVEVPADAQNGIRAVALGLSHNLAVRSDGTVLAWGSDTDGQSDVPVGLDGVKSVAGGRAHSLALKSDGTVVAWGSDSHGQISIPGGVTGVRGIAAGYNHSLALRGDGTVVAWGENFYGQSTVPPGLTGVIAVTASEYHSVALRSDGTVTVWGGNGFGELDVPNALTGVVAVAAGAAHTVALKRDGTVVAWGLESDGQTLVPPGLNGAVAITAGRFFSAALKSDGTVVAWGQEGLPTNVPEGLSGVSLLAAGGYRSLAVRTASRIAAWGSSTGSIPAGLGDVTSLSSSQHNLAVRSDGTVAAWGANGTGQATVPPGLAGVIAVAAGGTHSLALRSDGTVLGWGDNFAGQATVPPGLNGVVAVAGGGAHSLALKANGTVVAWGDNSQGQRTVPPGLTGVMAIAAGYTYNLALKSDGTVVAWGNNAVGQASVPPGLTGVTAIQVGLNHSVALKSDGTVVAWGDNSLGQAAVPPGLSGVLAVSAGFYHTLVVMSDGAVRSWGGNSGGQSAVPLGLLGVTAASGGSLHSLVLTANRAPSLTAPLDQETLEDVPTEAIPFMVGDPDSPAGLTVSAISAPPDLVQGFTFGGSGANRTVEITPAANVSGTSTVTLTVLDGNLSASASFQFTVLPVNDPPSFVKGADRMVVEDSGPQSFENWATAIQAGPTGDEWNQNRQFQVTGNTNPELFITAPAVSPFGGDLTFTPAADAHGASVITLVLRDAAGTANDGIDTSPPQTFTITVTPVNDAPVATASLVSTGEETPVAVPLGATDVDGDTLTYSVRSGPTHGVLSGTGDARTYTPALNYSGPDSFSFRVSDGTVDSNEATVTLTVNPVNDPPSAVGNGYSTPYVTRLDVAVPGVLGNDTDPEGNPLTAVLVMGPTNGTLALQETGSFTYLPNVGFSGGDTFTYRASDGAGQSAPVTVTLTVGNLPVNTPSAKVSGSGSVLVNGVKVKFTISAAFKRKLSGKLTFKDLNPARAVKKAVISAVVVSGRHAQVFGVATMADRSTTSFVVDLDDPVRGGGPDRFGLRLANGETVPSSVVTGKVTIKP